MKREAFKMYLKAGSEKEYQKRHSEIWPELVKLLKANGVSDYSIFWDKETNILHHQFAELLRHKHRRD